MGKLGMPPALQPTLQITPTDIHWGTNQTEWKCWTGMTIHGLSFDGVLQFETLKDLIQWIHQRG